MFVSNVLLNMQFTFDLMEIKLILMFVGLIMSARRVWFFKWVKFGDLNSVKK